MLHNYPFTRCGLIVRNLWGIVENLVPSQLLYLSTNTMREIVFHFEGLIFIEYMWQTMYIMAIWHMRFFSF